MKKERKAFLDKMVNHRNLESASEVELTALKNVSKNNEDESISIESLQSREGT